MSLAVSRRRFLQISSATVLAGAAAGLDPIPRSAIAAARPAAPGEVKTVPTFCEMCFWRCGGIAYVRDGKLWKFEGNPLDPQSRGRLCPRGTGAVGAVNDPDRLRTPLIRVGERGKEQWKSVTWGEALDLVAQKMQKIKAEHGPESLAVFNHGIGARFIVHLAEELRRHQHRRALVRAVPRSARHRLPPHLRHRPGVARAHRHREHQLPGAGRLAPRREHAQLAGAGVRQGGRAPHPDHRRRSALLGGREQGEVLAADQAGHRPRAAAGVDERARHRRPLRQGVRREVRPRLRQVRRRKSRSTRPSGRPPRPASTRR